MGTRIGCLDRAIASAAVSCASRPNRPIATKPVAKSRTKIERVTDAAGATIMSRLRLDIAFIQKDGAAARKSFRSSRGDYASNRQSVVPAPRPFFEAAPAQNQFKPDQNLSNSGLLRRAAVDALDVPIDRIKGGIGIR